MFALGAETMPMSPSLGAYMSADLSFGAGDDLFFAASVTLLRFETVNPNGDGSLRSRLFRTLVAEEPALLGPFELDFAAGESTSALSFDFALDFARAGSGAVSSRGGSA